MTEVVQEAAAPSLERFLVEEQLLTEAQVGRAQRIRSRLEDPKPLPVLVVELGWVSRAAMDSAVQKFRRALPIDDVLVDKGLLTVEGLEKARAQAGVPDGEILGRRLVDAGLVSEADYLQTYCERFDIPFVEPDLGLVDPDVLKKVSQRYLSRHRVLPLSIQDGRLNILVDDLPDRQVLAELERLYGVPLTLSVGLRDKIEAAIASIPQNRGEIVSGSQGAIQYHHLQEDVDSDRITGIVDAIILKAIRQGASDIHVEPMQSKVRVRFRVDGSLVHSSDYPQSYQAQIVSRIKVLAEADVAEHRIHQDGKISVRMGEEDIDLRASFYCTVFGENAVLRILRKSKNLIGLDELGFPPAVLRAFEEEVLDPSTGIVLVTGPTGSGKTTTLYAAVDRINDPSKKIITCEDPVEYVIEGITQCSVANRPGLTFVDSLKAIVRQDPDVILIGEVRDRDSADMAIQSALTGHKVLTTFHTEDSVGALVRLMDMNIETFLIASTITGVIAQRLLRRVCPHCRVEETASPREIRALGLSREDLAAFPLTKGRGCANCLYTGFRGRTGVYELMVMSDAVRDAILQRRPTHEIKKIAADGPGFMSLQEVGIVKALRGETTLREVIENTPRAAKIRPVGRLMEAYD